MDKFLESYDILSKSYDRFRYPKEDNPSFIFFDAGNNYTVLFSCPHAVKQVRNGVLKSADYNTGPLGLALHNLGLNVQIKTKNCNDDANYDLKSDYKENLITIIKQNNVKFLIDLHGMATTRDELICLGTNFGKNLNDAENFTDMFYKIATSHNFQSNKIKVDYPFSASYEGTVSAYIRTKTNINTLQIELNSKIFFSKQMTINLMHTLNEFANELTKQLQNEVAPIDKNYINEKEQ